MPEQTLPAFLRTLQEECGGAIPFERFMQEALYHPRFGYYTANIRDVGRHGDFSTSATLDQGVGTAIAAWIRERAEKSGWLRVPVIEAGAGNGHLARTVLKRLGWAWRLRTSYTIVEASPVLRRRQQDLLRGRGVRWADSMEQALERSGGRALIFSNELVDAFPCRVFEKTEEGWCEQGIRLAPDDSIRQVLIPLKAGDQSSTLPGNAAPGHRVERHDSYRKWLRSWEAVWREGALLTIDYGAESPPETGIRGQGTVRAYWKHQRITGLDVLARFGKQDITADVNFRDLIRWGEELCWKTSAIMTQWDFLSRHGNPAREETGSRHPLMREADQQFLILEQIR